MFSTAEFYGKRWVESLSSESSSYLFRVVHDNSLTMKLILTALYYLSLHSIITTTVCVIITVAVDNHAATAEQCAVINLFKII